MVKREWNLKGTTRKDLENADHFRIKVLTKPTDELVGVSKEVWDKALEHDIADWEASGKMLLETKLSKNLKLQKREIHSQK